MAGHCKPVCGPSQTNCGGVCVDTATNPANCGGCGNVCGPSTPNCSAGKCSAATCTPKCIFDMECQSTCGSHPAGTIFCCDTSVAACYLSPTTTW